MQNLKVKYKNNKKRNWLIALIIVVILVATGIVLFLTQSTRISAELGQAKA